MTDRPEPINDVLWQLARPSTETDRRRERLVAIGVAGCGMFLLAALAILTIRGDSQSLASDSNILDRNGNPIPVDQPSAALTRLAPYLAQSGLRGGTAAGAVLLVVPFVLFGLQALRTGTAARERRLAALSLAGATRAQLRRLAFLEGTRAAVAGALLAGPGYLGLWLIFGLSFPDGSKMLPTPGPAVAAGWPVLIIVLTLVGGLAARLSARPATVSALGMTRRRPRPLGLRSAIAPVVSFALILLAGLGLAFGTSSWWLAVIFPAVIVFAVSIGPWLILLTGRLAIRRGLLTTMAGRRLLADVRSPGRVVGVLLAVGIAFGVIAAMVADLLVGEMNGQNYGDGVSFYLAGFGAAGTGALVACVVASSSLVVGATEQVLDGRRGTAVLVALAASPRFVCAVVRRQLLLAAIPASVIGAVLGWLAAGRLLSADGGIQAATLSLPSALAVSALAATLGAIVAARAVRPAILEASGSDNLRAP
jgi:hypothetical protein